MSGRGSSTITDAGTERIDHRYEWSRQLRFAPLSQIWRSNSKVVHDTQSRMIPSVNCTHYGTVILQMKSSDLIDPLATLQRKRRLITLTAFRLWARAGGGGGGGGGGGRPDRQQGRMRTWTRAVRACAATVLAGRVGSDRDPPPKSAEANSRASGLLGSFSGPADIFYAFFILVKG